MVFDPNSTTPAEVHLNISNTPEEKAVAPGLAQADAMLTAIPLALTPDELHQGLLESGQDPARAAATTQALTGTAPGPAPQPEMYAGPLQGLIGAGKRLFQRGLMKPLPALTEAEAKARLAAGGTPPPSAMLGTTPFDPNFAGVRAGSGQGIRDELARAIEASRADFEKARGSMTDEQATAAAKELIEKKLPNYVSVLGLTGDSLNQVETRAVLWYLNSAVGELLNLRKYAGSKKLTPRQQGTALEAFRDQASLVDALMGKIAGWRREAGATTREYAGFDMQQAMQQGHAVHDAIDVASRFKDVPPDKMLLIADSLKTERDVLEFFSRTSRFRNVAQVLESLWVDQVLWSHETFGRNLIGNTTYALTTIPERFLAEGGGIAWRAWDALRGNPETQHVVPGEAWAMVKAIPDASVAMWSAMGEAFKTGESKFAGRKFESSARLGSSILPANSPDFIKAGADYLGFALGFVSRGMFAADEGAKTYLMQVNKRAIAHRYAELFGNDAKSEYAAYQGFLKNAPMSVELEALREAQTGTFTDKVGPLGEVLQKFANNVPVAGRMIVGFIQAPTRINAAFLQRFPVTALLAPTNWNDLAIGGVERDKMTGRVMAGGLTALGAFKLYQAGICVGGGPQDPQVLKALRANEGFEPYTCKVGNTRIAYRDIKPLGDVMAATMDFYETLGALKDRSMLEITTALALSWGYMLSQQSFTDQLSRLLQAIAEEDPEKWLNWVGQQTAPLIPGNISELRVARGKTDPLRRQTMATGEEYEGSLVWREIQQAVNAERNMVPGLSKGLPVEHGIFGEDLYTPRTWGITPIRVNATEVRDDLLYRTIFSLDILPRDLMPPKTVGGPERRPVARDLALKGFSHYAGLDLPDAPDVQLPQYGETGLALSGREWETLKVKRATVTHKGRTLEDTLWEYISPDGAKNDRWRRMSDGPQGEKALFVKAVFGAYEKLALNQMFKDESGLTPLGEEAQYKKRLKKIRRSLGPQEPAPPRPSEVSR